MRSFWCHHGANYNALSLPSIPTRNFSQYRPSLNNNPTPPSPAPLSLISSLQTILHDLKTHYTSYDPSVAEHALVRDLVHDWNERRLLAYWKCLEHNPRRAVEIVRLMGLDFGEGREDALVERALRKLKKYPRRERFEVVARALQQVGNGDEVLGLEDPQFVLSYSRVAGEGS
ncbi:hypothetical protein yc1106_04188 [Curvularia clavata]|uniref:Uncharacterized protein n=1 Tax=Curvularia clavata TaxID=95742 RepID=A0A9Q9DSM5_CURCL|nr:hypothetical protein yc1106_04188 [Curvularia clavata]